MCKRFPSYYTLVLRSNGSTLTYSNIGQMSLTTRGRVVMLWKSGLTVSKIQNCLQEKSVERLCFGCGQLLCNWIHGATQSIWWSDRGNPKKPLCAALAQLLCMPIHPHIQCTMEASMHQKCFTAAKDLQGTASVLVGSWLLLCTRYTCTCIWFVLSKG